MHALLVRNRTFCSLLRRLVMRVLRWEAPRPEGGRQGNMPDDSYSEILSG